jgi:aminopeptidase-like protein
LKRFISIVIVVVILLTLNIYSIGAEAISQKAGLKARSHMEFLAKEIGPRVAGTENEAKAGEYIISTFKTLGYDVQIQPFKYSVKRNGEAEVISSANIIAVKPGISKQEIIVGAHYDSVDAGKGADDNASGVGVLLELAELVKNIETPYTVRFIAFGAEEDWFKGSRHYVDEMSNGQKSSIINMICVDSVAVGDFLYVYGDFGTKGVIRDFALDTAKTQNLDLITQMGTKKYPAGTTGDFSDFSPFKDAGVPYTSFEATNWGLGAKDGYTQVNENYGVSGEIWHTMYDNIEYIDKTFPGRCDSHLYTIVSILKEILTKYQ